MKFLVLRVSTFGVGTKKLVNYGSIFILINKLVISNCYLAILLQQEKTKLI
jgi:hypothetical protein